MALAARIHSVTHTQQVDRGDGTNETVDLSLSGRFVVEAEYFDTAKPTTVLLTHSFELPVNTTVDEARAVIVEYGRSVRDSRLRVNELAQFVGAVIPLD